jgi:hypothetical protein
VITAAAPSVWPSGRASSIVTAERRQPPGLVRSATKVPEALQVLGRDVGADLLTGDRERRTAADKLQRLGPGDEEDLVSAGAGDFTHRELWAWLDHRFTGPPTVLIASQAVLDLG